MMGRQDRDQRQLFYEFRLEEMIPAGHLLRRINVFATAVLADLHEQLKAFYSDLGRPSVDPELMIRILLVGRSAIVLRFCTVASRFTENVEWCGTLSSRSS
jgi:transposase